MQQLFLQQLLFKKMHHKGCHVFRTVFNLNILISELPQRIHIIRLLQSICKRVGFFELVFSNGFLIEQDVQSVLQCIRCQVVCI